MRLRVALRGGTVIVYYVVSYHIVLHCSNCHIIYGIV